jgi:hypothetical protein
MCKKAFLYMVGALSFTLDGFENSYQQAAKKIEKGRQNLPRRSTKK